MKINPNVNLAESFERLKDTFLESRVSFYNQKKTKDIGIAYAIRTGKLIGAIQAHLANCTDYDLLTSENDLLKIDKQFTQSETNLNEKATTTDVQQ